MSVAGLGRRFIGAIDQGTSSTRFLLYNDKLQHVAAYQIPLKHILPRPGWVEMDPMAILDSVNTCVAKVMTESAINASEVKGIGITNQRETTVVWDRKTGKPLHNAVVWLDTRTKETVTEFVKKKLSGNVDGLRETCGLPVSTYFSALKLKWLIQNVPVVKEAAKQGNLMFGTIDTWVTWNLTGGVKGGQHVTDITNASRTMLMGLDGKWHEKSCDLFEVPRSVLPKIRSSAEIYGQVIDGPLKGVPISGCLGDQQAATVGQMCFRAGEVKNTYGTGSFLLMNTDTTAIQSSHGLLTTPCYQLGKHAPIFYALEGSVAVAGVGIKWMRDKLGLITSPQEMNQLAKSVDSTDGVYFVPALSGLLAPYWRDDARATIVGMSHSTTKAHLCRAFLEGMCFQTREVVEAMEKDANQKMTKIKVDGGVSQSDVMLGILANTLGVEVVRPQDIETTCQGAAIAAGIGAGVFADVHEVRAVRGATQKFFPEKGKEVNAESYKEWKRAVQASLGWG